jgi:pimeloyl-ACP methyl ester carboxylesterase
VTTRVSNLTPTLGPVASVVEELVDVGGGARLRTATEGTGRPVVLCHGGPGGVDMLDAVSPMIRDLARVHRFEQRACGRSSGGPPFTMVAAVADLDTLRRHWGHDRWVVGGHSFGAALALAYALDHPDRVDGVIYLSCVFRLDVTTTGTNGSAKPDSSGLLRTPATVISSCGGNATNMPVPCRLPSKPSSAPSRSRPSSPTRR